MLFFETQCSVIRPQLATICSLALYKFALCMYVFLRLIGLGAYIFKGWKMWFVLHFV